jgi:hypothetical protein
MASPSTLIERRLANELALKRRQLRRIEKEIAQIEAQIRHARRAGVQTVTAERSTSIQRLTVEAAIVNYLNRRTPPEASADEMWPTVQALGVTSRSTLRSYLRRMKERGLLLSPSRGKWRLASGVQAHQDLKAAAAPALAALQKR